MPSHFLLQPGCASCCIPPSFLLQSTKFHAEMNRGQVNSEVGNQGQGTLSIPCFFLFSQVGFDLLFSIFLFLRAVSKELRLGGGIAENVYADWVMRAVYPGWIAGEKF